MRLMIPYASKTGEKGSLSTLLLASEEAKVTLNKGLGGGGTGTEDTTVDFGDASSSELSSIRIRNT
jgi:hypothetical protein